MRNPSLPVPVFALAMAMAVLSGCIFETKVAGGAEDFPNTLSALGASVSNNLSAHAEWDQFSNIPAVDIQAADSLVVAPQANASGAAGLAKLAAEAPDTTWDLSDTLTRGIGRRFIRNESPTVSATDTTIFRWDDKARDSVRGNELILETRGVEDRKAGPLLPDRHKAYRFENLDSSGGFDRAFFYERVSRTSGIHNHKLVVMKPGADGDFATKADNRPVYFASLRTLGPDTLDAYEVKDADGDGQLWADNDSGLVDVRHRQTDPFLRPSVALYTQRMRAVFFREAGRSYPVSYSESRTDRDGRVVAFSIKGYRSDSTFGPGDTVTVTVRTIPSPDAAVKVLERTSRFRILLAEAPGQFARNLLLHFSMETRWREGAFMKGAVRATRLTFVPDAPMPAGGITLAGKLRMEAEFADGSTGTLDGRFLDRRIEADLVEIIGGPRAGRYRVQWDATEEGRILRQERLAD